MGVVSKTGDSKKTVGLDLYGRMWACLYGKVLSVGSSLVAAIRQRRVRSVMRIEGVDGEILSVT